MSTVNWLNVLNWGKEEIEEIRYVGYCYLKEGMFDVALTIFHSLALLTPDDPYVLQTLGAIYLEQGNFLAALNHLEKALKLDPTNLPCLLNRAKALFALGYKKQAILQAQHLSKSENKKIASQAQALLMAY